MLQENCKSTNFGKVKSTHKLNEKESSFRKFLGNI